MKLLLFWIVLAAVLLNSATVVLSIVSQTGESGRLPNLDAAELAAYFCEDGTYHNVPLPPVVGRANIEEAIRAFTASWTATRWEILNLLTAGDVVVAERVDRTRCVGDRSVELPIVGVFELDQGKIKVWRDYFDLGTYLRAVADHDDRSRLNA